MQQSNKLSVSPPLLFFITLPFYTLIIDGTLAPDVGLYHLDLRRRGKSEGFLEPSIADLRCTTHRFCLALRYSPVISFIISRKAASFDLLLDVVESQLSCFG
jgi:hypothetical protein